MQLFYLTGDIEPGLPTFKLPPFQIERQVDDDEIQVLNFSDICAEIGAMGIVLFPLVSILEQVAIAKTYCRFRIRCGLFLIILLNCPLSPNQRLLPNVWN